MEVWGSTPPFIVSLTNMEEKIINSWPVNYISSNGEKYKGQLTISSSRLMYSITASNPPKKHQDSALFIKLGEDHFVMIKKKDIGTIIITKKMFEKTILIRTKDHQEHCFDCGSFNINSIARVLSQL